MTTRVTIEACCAESKEVHVIVSDDNQAPVLHILQNEESHDLVVYDSKEVTISEVDK